MRTDQLRKAYSLQVKWTAFPLHPDIPEDGIALADLFKGTDIDINKVEARLKATASELGLPLGDRKKAYNTRLAQELAKWAEVQEAGDAFHRAVFHAYFVDGMNIGKIEELVSVAEDLGLSSYGARKALASRTHRETVDAEWARSRQLGITAVPTFVMDHDRITGAQPYEALEKFVKAHLTTDE